MKYILLESVYSRDKSYRQSLEEQVQRHLDAGWKLQGGVSVSITQNRHYGEMWAQAMVKDVESGEGEGEKP